MRSRFKRKVRKLEKRRVGGKLGHSDEQFSWGGWGEKGGEGGGGGRLPERGKGDNHGCEAKEQKGQENRGVGEKGEKGINRFNVGSGGTKKPSFARKKGKKIGIKKKQQQKNGGGEHRITLGKNVFGGGRGVGIAMTEITQR